MDQNWAISRGKDDFRNSVKVVGCVYRCDHKVKVIGMQLLQCARSDIMI